ncbi:MAG: DUF11 domain-containing protein, partial [Wenzhouxiangella sp.]
FDRDGDGALDFMGHVADAPVLVDPRSIVVDGSGARVYLLDGGGGLESPAIHVFARDWIDGGLDYRFSQPLVGTEPRALVQLPEAGEVLVSATTPGGIIRLTELALSRCLQHGAPDDAIVMGIDLGVGGWSKVVYDATVHPSARGNLVNTAGIEPSLGKDPELANNTSTSVTPVLVVSDLAVTKSGPAEAVAGETITYEIKVTNAGPSDALGIRIQDLAPAELLDVDWTCAANGNSSCPPAGTGIPDITASLLVGDEITVQVGATIDPAFVGQLVNGVIVHPEAQATDPNPDGQTDEVVTTVTAVADVSVDKQTLSDPVVAGATVSYRLTVNNAGPSDAPVVALLDILATTLVNGQWECSASGQASCPVSGSGNIDFEASVPAGGSLELIITADLPPNLTGQLANQFTATVLNDVEDPDLTNNAADVIDLIEVHPDLAVSLDAPMNPFDPQGSVPLPLVATVTNLGPSTARDVTLDWLLSDPAVLVAHPECSQPEPDAIRCELGTLEPGVTRQVELELRNLPSDLSELVVDALVAISGDDGGIDPDLNNNHDSVSVQFMKGGDVRVLIDNNVSALLLGESVTYQVVVENVGSQAVNQIDVSVPVPPELLDAAWTCSGRSGAVCQSDGIGDIVDTVSLDPRQRVTYRLEVRVDPSTDLSVPKSVTVTAVADVTPSQADINLVNNVAVIQNIVDVTLFRDRFEAVLETESQTLQQIVRGDSACIDTRLEFSAMPRFAGGGTGRLFEGRATTGEAVIWLDAFERHDCRWLQLSYLLAGNAEVSGWQAWPAGRTGLVVRIAEGIPSLQSGSNPIWQGVASIIVMPEYWLQPPLRVLSVPEISMTLVDCSGP